MSILVAFEWQYFQELLNWWHSPFQPLWPSDDFCKPSLVLANFGKLCGLLMFVPLFLDRADVRPVFFFLKSHPHIFPRSFSIHSPYLLNYNLATCIAYILFANICFLSVVFLLDSILYFVNLIFIINLVLFFFLQKPCRAHVHKSHLIDLANEGAPWQNATHCFRLHDAAALGPGVIGNNQSLDKHTCQLRADSAGTYKIVAVPAC